MGKYIEKAQLQHVSIMLIRVANALPQYCSIALQHMLICSTALLQTAGQLQHVSTIQIRAANALQLYCFAAYAFL
jgi:hypothetical protein